MWRFLSAAAFHGICTLTALAVVWAYEIASPLRWAFVVPAVACDLWRICKPFDHGAGEPRHPIRDDPNVPLWTFGAFCLCVLAAAPLLRFACFETLTDFLGERFGMSGRKIAEAGGACATPYGTVFAIYMAAAPIFVLGAALRCSVLFKKDKRIGSGRKLFEFSPNLKRAASKIHLGLLPFFFFFVKFMPFDHQGSRMFAPVDEIFSIATVMILHFSMMLAIGLFCRTACFVRSD